MGHVRVGRLPRTRKWQQVVELISGGASANDIAAATSKAAETEMCRVGKDPTFIRAFWLLTQLPLAARKIDFTAQLRYLGLEVSDRPSLIEIVQALSDSVDRHARRLGGRTDVGEMAQLCAAESLTAVAGRELPGLFAPTAEDVKTALAGLGTVRQYSVLARDFFSRLTRRYLNYFLSRELSNHVGANGRFRSVAEHAEFENAIDLHCRETSRIIKEFSGEWFSKTNYEEGGIDERNAGRFVHVTFKKFATSCSSGGTPMVERLVLCGGLAAKKADPDPDRCIHLDTQAIEGSLNKVNLQLRDISTRMVQSVPDVLTESPGDCRVRLLCRPVHQARHRSDARHRCGLAP